MQQTIDYLVAGQVTVDLVEGQGRAMGGPALFTAITARNLGARVACVTSAAHEPELDSLLAGVAVHRTASEHTTTFAVRYHQGGRTQWIRHRATPLSPHRIPPSWLDAPVVHLAPEWGEFEPGFAAAFTGRLFLTPQGFLRRWHDDGEIYQASWDDAERLLARAEAVVVSHVDLPDPDQIPQWAARTRLLVVTHAERGSTVYCRNDAYHARAFRPVAEVDPTGAGDVFAAAYFWWLAQDGHPYQGAEWANCVASFAVEGNGCSSIPELAQVEQRWQNGQRITL